MRTWRNTVVRFGLLVVPVALSPLVGGAEYEGQTTEIATGERVRRAWTTNGKDIIPNEETETRYPRPDGDPVALDVAISGETGIDVEAALHIGDVDAGLFDSSYAANPSKDAPRAFAALLSVLRDDGRILVGRARFTESASAKSVVLRYSSLTKGIVLETLSPLARVRIADARKETEGIADATEAEIVQARTFLDSLPDVLPDLIVHDERDEAIRGALAALASASSEDEDIVSDEIEATADLVDAVVRGGYEAAKRKRAKDAEKVAS